MTTPERPFYVTGGTLSTDASSYVVRQADQDLMESLRAGEYCYVLNTRQMGKSSLCVRTIARLSAQGVRTVFLDLTKIGAQNVTPEQWYAGLLSETGRALDLRREFVAHWKAHADLSPLQRFFGALRDVALEAIPDPIVVFVDEIDAVRSLSFSTDEFFAAVRECHNRRAQDPTFERLAFCLLGVATPADLIQDTRISPFNIGRRIELSDFTPGEAAPLAAGLGESGAALLSRVLHWTGGHPYMTQRLCRALAESPEAARFPRDVDRACERLFLTKQARDTDDNLTFVRNRLLRSEVDLASLLDLYKQVRSGKRVKDDETNPLTGVLRLSGVTRVVGGFLQIRNRIYDRVFDRDWVQTHMPDAELRRQKAAYHRGLVRAASVAAAVVVVMGLLAAAATTQAARADRNRELADRQLTKAEALSESLRIALRREESARHQLENALREVQTQRRIADTSAKRASREAARASTEARRAKTAQRSERAQKVQAVLARRQALVARDEAVQERGLANRARRQAEAQRRVAETKTEESRRSLVRLSVANGQRLVEEGDLLGSLLWFAEAQRLETGHPDGEAKQNLRFELTRSQAPRLVRMWFHPVNQRFANFLPGGQSVVLLGKDGALTTWSAKTDTLSRAALPLPSGTETLGVSPDGSRVLTRRRDGALQLWDVMTRRPIFPPVPHPAPVALWDLSDNGTVIGVVSSREANQAGVQVVDLASGKMVTICDRVPDRAIRIAVSPDGRRVLLATSAKQEEGTPAGAQVWDAATGKPIGPLLKTLWHIGSARFSPDSRRIVVSSRDGLAQVLDMTSAVPRVVPLGKSDYQWLNDALFSPDGSKVVTISAHNDARVWDASNGTPLTPSLKHDSNLYCAAFSPDGQQIVTGASDGIVQRWNIASANRAGPPLKHNGFVRQIVFDPAGRFLLTSCVYSGQDIRRVWDMVPPAQRRSHLTDEWEIKNVAFSPDSRQVATTSSTGVAQIWDVATAQPAAPPLKHGKAVWDAQFSPDGRWIVTASEDKTARVWDARTGEPITPPLVHNGPVRSACFDPQGRRVLTGSDDGTVRLWDVRASRQIGASFLHPTEARKVAFSPDGAWIAAACAPENKKGGAAFLWNLRTRRRIAVAPNAQVVWTLSFSPDGRRLLTASGNHLAQVWEVTTGRELIPALKHGGAVYDAAFSPDGRRIATACMDNTAQLWDAQRGQRISSPLKHDAGVNAVQFSPDGTLLVTASGDGTTRLWDAANGEPMAILRNDGGLQRVVFSPNGRYIAAASKGARVWEIPQRRRPAKDTLRMARLLSCQQIDPIVGPVPIEESVLEQIWRDLSGRYPGDFFPYDGSENASQISAEAASR